jgi:hypothetical protein
MKIDRNKLAELYEEFLENNDTEGHLPVISKNVIDTICFLIENNEDIVDVINYGTIWYSSISHDIKIKNLDNEGI